MSDNIYNTFLQKRSEASIVKAANLSDIQFIDPAKDVGRGLLGPKTSVNYVLAFFMGLIIPLILVFFIFFISNSVQNIEDISAQTQLPLIGIVGIKHSDSNLSVFERQTHKFNTINLTEKKVSTYLKRILLEFVYQSSFS